MKTDIKSFVLGLVIGILSGGLFSLIIYLGNEQPMKDMGYYHSGNRNEV